MDSTGLVGSYIRVCTITLVVEIFLSYIKYLAELYERVETLDIQVKYLYEQLFVSLVGKHKLHDFNYFVARQSLRRPEQREVLKVIKNTIH